MTSGARIFDKSQTSDFKVMGFGWWTKAASWRVWLIAGRVLRPKDSLGCCYICVTYTRMILAVFHGRQNIGGDIGKVLNLMLVGDVGKDSSGGLMNKNEDHSVKGPGSKVESNAFATISIALQGNHYHYQ